MNKPLIKSAYLLILGASLTIGSVNAMTYNVGGNRTQIELQESTLNNGVTIDRGVTGEESIPFNEDSNGCSKENINGEDFILCQKTFEDGEDTHTITVTNPQEDTKFDIVYLNNANITSIANFNGFKKIGTLNLDSNPNIQISNSTFQGLTILDTLYLSYNQLTDFSANIYNLQQKHTNSIKLNNNSYTTIPSNIWNNKQYYKIKLSNSVTYKSTSNDYTIDLSNNDINFIDILSPSGSTRHNDSYTFTRFGYSHEHEDGSSTYEYTLKRDGSIVKSGQDYNSTGITINDFRDGTYEFEICIDNIEPENICDSISFSNDITGNLRITRTPNTNPVTSRVISFSWTQSGYPTEYISGYTYSIKKTGGATITKTTTNTSTGFDITELFPDTTTGSFTFSVDLINTDNNIGATAQTGFQLKIDSTLNITKPRDPQITANNVTGVNVTFEREGNSVLLENYHYTLTNSDGDQILNETGKITSFEKFLGVGSYTLHVEMLKEGGGIIAQDSKTITINIPTTLTIQSPSAGSHSDNDINFRRNGFSPFYDHYEFNLQRTDGGTTQITGGSTNNTGFNISSLHHGTYTFTVNINSSTGTIISTGINFEILDNIDLKTAIISNESNVGEGATIRSNTATFSRDGTSEDFSGFYYSITGISFSGQEYNYSGTTFGQNSGSITLNNLVTGRYRFTVKMLSGSNIETDVIQERSTNFNVSIPAFLTITSPMSGATITSSYATFSWTGYSDTITRYDYKLTSDAYNLDTNNFTTNTSFSRNDLKDGNYTLTVRISSGGNLVAEDTVNFTVKIPAKSSGGGGSSSKSHPTNNLSLSLGNDSPTANEWIQLIVKISDKYTGKVSFPKIQYYSGDTEKWIDIPVTSKNFVSDYSDDAKLGYVRFTSDDDGRKDLNQFIKFSKNGHYRIYAEDKDGFDTYVQIHVGAKKTVTNTGTTNSTGDVNSILREYIPEIFENTDTQEEVYIARSCKKYTIIYSDTLNIYTSPNLNISEFFINKDYLKRYLDSKNRYQSGCPTNIGWITTSYIDRTNSSSRYTAPNGKVYLIVGEEGNYYSNELNRELKTPTSFKTIAELKYYIRDRNPLINMATLGPVN